MTGRHQRLHDWAAARIAALEGSPAGELRLESLSGDASFRRYYRARWSDRSYIVVDAPPENEDSRTFVAIADRFRAAGVQTPQILSADFEAGFMLQEDFGDRLYLHALRDCEADPERVVALYRKAIDSLIVLQRNVASDGFPPFDRATLLREMCLFQDWFCGRFLGLALTETELTLIESTQNTLATEALAQPAVVVHRDYHSRNLMIPDPERYPGDGPPGVIDFQDAVVGSYTYDLVSLLRDCYISWPEPLVLQLCRDYLQQAERAGIVNDPGEQEFLRHFDLMGLQRNLKVIGIFSRLTIRDNKPQFLADIPQTMRYFLTVASRHPEMTGFVDWFRNRVLPLASERLPAGSRCEE